jgi:hypothetical protein
MTEAEWLACNDPATMLEFLRGKASDRKCRLVACACCGLAWPFIADDRNRRAVELGERLADGATELLELATIRASTRDGTAWCALMDSAWDAAFHSARSGAGDTARSAIRGKRWGGREERDTVWWHAWAAARLTQAGILLDIFGNPFRPAALDPAWLTADVASLAQAAYVERELPGGRLDPGRLAVLSDALEDAGCAEAAILSHLRSPGLHVRGCWALDLILGKQ